MNQDYLNARFDSNFEVLDEDQNVVNGETDSHQESDHHGTGRPFFNVTDPINGILTVQMNFQVARMLQDFIYSMDGEVEKEIWALRKALQNPARAREFRQSKMKNSNR